MKKKGLYFILSAILVASYSCQTPLTNFKVYETSWSGKSLELTDAISNNEASIQVRLYPDSSFQSILGFGGSFTESSAYLVNQMSSEKRKQIINAYFSDEGAQYSLTRTHINSCDFSLKNYAYSNHPGDKNLSDFSIDEDRDDIIPMIKDAMKVSSNGFKIVSSPWTAPPWMKDNNSWKGGKLLPEYYDTWALYFSKYLKEYQKEGIDIWGITVENEPLGNGYNWESMHYSPEETVEFTNKHLGPTLKENGHDVKILAYDQNRGEELIHWANEIYANEASSEYIDGIAVHWYASTFDWFPESLEHTYHLAPDNILINSEACVDAEVPHWQDDEWYWMKEATDWGYDWAPEDRKHKHPKYAPVYRYARNIIGSLNSYMQGWIDWNMVLDTQGGPNWANNWCIAPVIVDPEKDEVYFTPLYYTMAHFSKFIKPEAKRIAFDNSSDSLMLTATKNTDGSIAVVVLNMEEEAKNYELVIGTKKIILEIDAQAIQTIVVGD